VHAFRHRFRTVSARRVTNLSCSAISRGIAHHLTKVHGADVGAARLDHTRDPDVHESAVAKNRLRACDGTVANTVVAQELLRKASAADSDGSATVLR